jgi:DNA-binding HxlR family transcriptional regulator
VLGRELKSLVETGMIQRQDHHVFPLKVEYELTTKGRSFIPIIDVIRDWGLRELAEPAKLRGKRKSSMKATST